MQQIKDNLTATQQRQPTQVNTTTFQANDQVLFHKSSATWPSSADDADPWFQFPYPAFDRPGAIRTSLGTTYHGLQRSSPARRID
ncbi:hypothetical protein H257_13155 [Aphanomyces astaci]|uniref:Uncharacterized protein n=1 Tax=Aphanomyces astaci TaxID=112090 RepID=W4FYI5_APHAT|nr:hypothetical protein H257_13155 [Aphanomyces astaci]ETV71728.1 hypothetical protein H257_13155 [Aphanomyces astaci]|eukprot:XP_009838916.1 hypothetical protein H257_13155 [Aphanomyces astaci]